MKTFHKYLFYILFTFLLTSCGEYELLEQHKECKKTADSLYRAHRDSLTISFDSLCAKNRDAYYQKALDSLTKARIEDIQNLIKK